MDIDSLALVLEATCKASECYIEGESALLTAEEFEEVGDTAVKDVLIAAIPLIVLTTLFFVSLCFIVYALVRVPRGTLAPGGAILPANLQPHVVAFSGITASIRVRSGGALANVAATQDTKSSAGGFGSVLASLSDKVALSSATTALSGGGPLFAWRQPKH